ncbi:MAG: hypothetical protein NC204_04675 [Candidatus Amulumruptor caecigallinarius]|nr:hypothetical protein [Candidatus Amulumruptor caecigallinarius]
MKTSAKTFTSSVLALMAVLLLTFVSSCSKTSPRDVAAKIDAKESLSQNDYGVIIDYCGEYAEKAQNYFNIISGQPNDSTRVAVEASQNLATLYQEYNYLDLFRNTLYSISDSDLDKSNIDKVNKYSKLEAFPLPGGAGVALENPDVVGMIEDTPNSDTSAVIATGDGEAVDVKVK